jgi:hypothetical protein
MLIVAIAVLLAACGDPGVNGPPAPPTATPIPPTPTQNPALASQSTGTITIPTTMPSISLGSYQAAALAATATGLVLAPPMASGSIVGTPTLAFVPFTGGTPKAIAQATPAGGAARSIIAFTTGGAWVAYVQAGPQGSAWELWAVNPTTGTQHMVDSATQEHESGILPGTFATDGTDVVWAVPTFGQNTASLFAYDLASGTTRTLASVSAASFVSVALVNRLLFYQTTTLANVSTSWLWLLTQPKGAQIAAQPKGAIALNSRYLAWYDADPGNLDLYDIVSGKTLAISENACENPIIAQDRPYLACLDDVDDQYQVIRVPSGTSANFGLHATGGFGAFANGRLYWIPEPNPLSANNQVDYFTLPTS